MNSGSDRKVMGPPVVKVALEVACSSIWGDRQLNAHLSDLERFLMIDAEAPVTFDGIPLTETTLRSKALVDVLMRSLQANPSLRPLVFRVGSALKADRMERTGGAADPGVAEAVELITRTVQVKQAFRPRV